MTSSPLRVAFAGTPDFAAASLQAVLDSPHTVVTVLTQPDRGAGRGKKVQQSPVKQLAESHGIPVLQPENLKGEEIREQLRALQLDARERIAQLQRHAAAAFAVRPEPQRREVGGPQRRHDRRVRVARTVLRVAHAVRAQPVGLVDTRHDAPAGTHAERVRPGLPPALQVVGRRAEQAREWMWAEVREGLAEAARTAGSAAAGLGDLEERVARGELLPEVAAERLVAALIGGAGAGRV